MTSESDYKTLLETIITTARKAAEEHARGTDAQSKAMVFAYCDILDAALSEAKVIGLDLNEFGLSGFDPYAFLAEKRAA